MDVNGEHDQRNLIFKGLDYFEYLTTNLPSFLMKKKIRVKQNKEKQPLCPTTISGEEEACVTV